MKKNKYLDDVWVPLDPSSPVTTFVRKKDREERVFQLSEIIMFLNDETLQRLADTGKTHVVTTAALYHLSAVCHEIWGKRKPMMGFIDTLTPEQKKAALAYRGPDM
jgi:hypothetical protein